MKYLTLLLVGFLAFSSCSSECEKPVSETIEINEDVVADSNSKLAVEGMVCSMGCVSAIQDELRSTPGVANAVVNYEEGTANIEYDSKLVNESELIAAIGNIGDHAYSAKVFEESVELTEGETEEEEVAVEE